MRHIFSILVPKTTATIIVTVGLLTLLLPLAAPPANGAARESMVTSADFESYCQLQGQIPQLVDNNAYGWRCGSAPISVTQVCQNLTRLPNIIDRMTNFYDPQGWECWSYTVGQVRVLNANDMTAFCSAFGFSSAGLIANNGYSWQCHPVTRNYNFPFIVSLECEMLLRQSAAIDRLGDFNDPYSWQCWL
jgi:hypothetical protein